MTKVLAGLALLLVVATGDDGGRHELHWLVGCWVSADGRSQEVWVIDNDQSMVGFGVTVTDGKVGFYEILSIRRNEGGVFVYNAHPSGQAGASFALTEVTDSSVVFRNPDHDYPQEIRYERVGSRLQATISLMGGVNPNSFDKVACD